MNYELIKKLIAFMGIVSVIVTLIASVTTMDHEFKNNLNTYIFLTTIAAVIAAVASIISIRMSRMLSRERDKKRIFLIYAREDLQRAKGISRFLSRKGFLPWLDVNEVKPGQVWQKTVKIALEQSSIALILVSPNLAKEGFVHEEIKTAYKTLNDIGIDRSPIIPLRLTESTVVPDELANIQWINYFDKNGEYELLQSLKSLLK